MRLGSPKKWSPKPRLVSNPPWIDDHSHLFLRAGIGGGGSEGGGADGGAPREGGGPSGGGGDGEPPEWSLLKGLWDCWN